MRLLVACPDCRQQFDATGRSSGDAFHCLCGRTLQVPAATFHDAAVVRCSSCGAPRQQREPRCRFCQSDFTLHERDLHTICPECAARVSDRASYCHHCATPILEARPVGEPSRFDCPACEEPGKLASRSLGEPPLPLLECSRCAGIWLGRESFEMLLQRSRRVAPAERARGVAPSGLPPTPPAGGPAGSRLYRPCPVCSKLMNRSNFGRRSGVVVDECIADGVWFDAHELDAILGWVRRGGESAVRHLQEEEARQSERETRLKKQVEPTTAGWAQESRGASLADLLSGFLGLFS